MKHLIKFNELKSDTYRSAARKLKQKGHKNRAEALMDHDEMIKWKKNIERYEKYGSANIIFANRKGSVNEKTGDFYFQVLPMGDMMAESIEDSIESGDDIRFYFQVNAIPKDIETKKLADQTLTVRDFYNGSYTAFYASLKYKNTSKGLELDGFYPELSDKYFKLTRRGSVVLKKHLLACFDKESGYGDYDGYPSDFEDILKILLDTGFTTEFEKVMSDIYDDIKGISVNDIFTD